MLFHGRCCEYVVSKRYHFVVIHPGVLILVYTCVRYIIRCMGRYGSRFNHQCRFLQASQMQV